MVQFIPRTLWLVLCVALFAGSANAGRIINGRPVPQGKYKEVVNIQSDGAGCTATVVGPKAIITAAHCATEGATATFSIGGTNYSAIITRSPVYPGQDHDIAVGVTNKEITGVEPAHVGGTASVGTEITLLGYGCTQIGGGGDTGKLLYGNSVVRSMAGFDMVSKESGGAALCFGDSGGPAFIPGSGGKNLLLGVNSKGNIQDTNYNCRTDIQESQDFLKNVAQSKNIKICGINSDCTDDPPPPPPAPSCQLKAEPSSVKKGNSLSLILTVTGTATSASINGETVDPTGGSIRITPMQVGTFTATGSVSGAGGTGSCSTNYMVTDDDPPPPPPPPDAPTCTLSATPNWIKLGKSLTLTLKTKGTVDKAYIDGQEVGFPTGNLLVTPTMEGNYSVSGVVIGGGSSSTCWTRYKVEGLAPPGTPNFAIIPLYCGENSVESKVKRVCLGLIKKDTSIQELSLTEAVQIEYKPDSPGQEGTKEVLLIVHRKLAPTYLGSQKIKENLILYTNSVEKHDKFMVLKTRNAYLTKEKDDDGEVPLELRGSTGEHMFIVDNFEAQ